MKNHRHLSLVLSIGFCLAVTAFPFAYSHSGDESEAAAAVPLDEARIKKDLMGKSLPGWTFDEGTVCRIKILDAEYEQDKAVLKTSMKAVKHVRRNPGWIGKGGELQLEYEYDGREWKLMNVEAKGLCDLAVSEIYNVRKTDGRPFLVAVDEGDVERVNALLDEGVNFYQRARRGETALMIAAGRGHVDVAKILVKKGIDVNASTLDGVTALMIAARLKQTEMVEFLLNNGADVNYEGPLGCNALLLALEGRPREQTASEKNLASTVNALLDQGARLNARDGRGVTPLWLALRCGEDDVVKLILDKGADVNMRAGPSGFTPLMGAVEVGRPALVKLLVERGADVNVSKDGVTAMRLAKTSQQRWNTKIELIQILKKAGAKK